MHPRTTLERKLHPCMQALPRRSPAKLLSGLGVQNPQSTRPLANTTSYSEIQHEPCITCEGQASMPWFEEITSQRDTTGRFRCESLYRQAEPKKAQPTWGELCPCPGSFVGQSASLGHHLLRGTQHNTRAHLQVDPKAHPSGISAEPLRWPP